MELSDLFWLISVFGAYRAELAEAGIGLSDRLAVGAVLADLYRLAGLVAPLDVEASVSNLVSLPIAAAEMALP